MLIAVSIIGFTGWYTPATGDVQTLKVPVPIESLITPTPKPNYDAEVLAPLHTAQAKAAVEAAIAAQLAAQKAAAAAELERQREVQAAQAKQAAAAQQVQVATVQGDSSDVPRLITKWAGYYGVSADYLLRIARCESGYSPSAVNRNYSAGGGNPSGVFQFLPDTFARYTDATHANFTGDIWNADDNVHAAAYAFSHGGSGEWECK